MTIADAFTLEERAAMAETSVRMMGIAQFAPLVVLAGHASESMNNLYQSALDCGACGGNPGAANARASAAITLLDRHLIPKSRVDAVQTFDRAQQRAAELLVKERAQSLPGASPHAPARVRGRAHDWAEVYPKLGLAGNAAMIIGPRQMTRGVTLDRRVFIHSYRTELDPGGAALETIMTAPWWSPGGSTTSATSPPSTPTPSAPEPRPSTTPSAPSESSPATPATCAADCPGNPSASATNCSTNRCA